MLWAGVLSVSAALSSPKSVLFAVAVCVCLFISLGSVGRLSVSVSAVGMGDISLSVAWVSLKSLSVSV